MNDSYTNYKFLNYIYEQELRIEREFDCAYGDVAGYLAHCDDSLAKVIIDGYGGLSELEHAYLRYRKDKDERSLIEQPHLSQLYDLKNNYGLIKVSPSISIDVEHEPSRIHDLTNHRTILVHTPFSLLLELKGLYDEHIIGELFLRGKDNFIYDSINNESRLRHYCRNCFDWDLFDLNESILFYEENYDNQLWISPKNNEIVFEELLAEKPVVLDSVKTQVVHLVYERNNGKTVITHIDHEYIYYSLDEFEKRKNDSSVKGTAHKRSKTFKVDNGAIPIDYICNKRSARGLAFLLFVLDEFFTRKELLNEFFAKCSQPNG